MTSVLILSVKVNDAVAFVSFLFSADYLMDSSNIARFTSDMFRPTDTDILRYIL